MNVSFLFDFIKVNDDGQEHRSGGESHIEEV